MKEKTNEIKEQDKKRVRSDSENQPPKKRRRTVENTDSFKGKNIRLEFRRRYNTRNSKKTSNTDSFNDSDNEEDDLPRSPKSNRPKLHVLFSWAKPYQRSIDLMKMGVCDVDEEKEETSSDDDSPKSTWKSRGHRTRVTKVEYDPSKIPSVDEITEEMLNNVAKKSSGKTYCKVKGSCCHQCRQKTLDTKTVCRSGECIGIRGQFCGPCLQGRYGENAVEALKDPVSLI